MKKGIGLFIILVGAVFSTCINQEQKATQHPLKFSRIRKGVSLSPRSFSSVDFTDFFEKATYAGNIVSWSGDWNELVLDTSDSGPEVITELAAIYEYDPLVVLQFFTQSSGALLRPLNENTTQAYLDSAVTFAEKYSPPYLGLGIEVNILYEKFPEDFEKFARFYNDVYHAVKEVSPDTKVFTVFQLERMKGLQGGLFGGKNDPANAQWELLDRFECDIIAFTTYPGLIYKNPSEIPQDYYDEIKLHTKTPVAFTEIGWHTGTCPPGWESSEAEQAAFITTFFTLIERLEIEFAVWSFLYDQDVEIPFDSMGLYNCEGDSKSGWEEWVRSGKHCVGLRPGESSIALFLRCTRHLPPASLHLQDALYK